MYNKDYCLLIYVLSVILIIITLLVVSVTGQVIEFDPSLNDTIYIEVCTYVVANVVTFFAFATERHHYTTITVCKL